MSAVFVDASPISILQGMRGRIVAAQIAYPDVLHVEIRDAAGAVWRLATQSAGFCPADPGKLINRIVTDAALDPSTGALRCTLDDGTSFAVLPPGEAAQDDPPSWELLVGSSLLLEFGPGLRWQIAQAPDAAAA